jgi:hypothetical protein
MNFDYRQGYTHAAQMFQGSLIDPVGAQQIVDNLEASLPSYPPRFAEGVKACADEARALMAREVRKV